MSTTPNIHDTGYPQHQMPTIPPIHNTRCPHRISKTPDAPQNHISATPDAHNTTYPQHHISTAPNIHNTTYPQHQAVPRNNTETKDFVHPRRRVETAEEDQPTTALKWKKERLIFVVSFNRITFPEIYILVAVKDLPQSHDIVLERGKPVFFRWGWSSFCLRRVEMRVVCYYYFLYACDVYGSEKRGRIKSVIWNLLDSRGM